MSLNILTLKFTTLCLDEVVEVDLARTSAPEAPLERYVEHTLRLEDASMHQPPAKPSRAADLGGGTLTIDYVIQIVTEATLQTWEPPEEHRCMIECALN